MQISTQTGVFHEMQCALLQSQGLQIRDIEKLQLQKDIHSQTCKMLLSETCQNQNEMSARHRDERDDETVPQTDQRKMREEIFKKETKDS